MKRINRKTTPKVVGGKPLKKNNHKETENYWNTSQKDVIIDATKPGKGYKHFLKKRDILKFISILPNWREVSQELDAIVLESGRIGCDGYYDNNGVIAIAAWEKDKDILLNESYFKAHEDLFKRLGIKVTKQDKNYFCEFDEYQIKAYQLLHILLHEIGHHIDRMKTKSKIRCARGEQFAEDYAFKYEKEIWKRYQEEFDVVLG